MFPSLPLPLCDSPQIIPPGICVPVPSGISSQLMKRLNFWWTHRLLILLQLDTALSCIPGSVDFAVPDAYSFFTAPDT